MYRILTSVSVSVNVARRIGFVFQLHLKHCPTRSFCATALEGQSMASNRVAAPAQRLGV